MIRIVLDINEDGDILGIKEAIAMALERFGSVRVVSIYDGRQR